MNSTDLYADTNMGTGLCRDIAGRAALIRADAHKAGAYAVQILNISDKLTGRRAYESDAEFELRMAEISLSLVLDDVRAARAKIAALPAPALRLEAAE